MREPSKIPHSVCGHQRLDQQSGESGSCFDTAGCLAVPALSDMHSTHQSAQLSLVVHGTK